MMGLNINDSWGTSINMGKQTTKDVRTNDLSEVFVYLSISRNVRVSRIILLAIERCRSLKLGFVIVMHDALSVWHC